MAKINKVLIALKNSNALKAAPKEERFEGTFKFVKQNGNGSFKYELIDVDKESPKLFMPEISVIKDEHEYLLSNDLKSMFYISQNPRIDQATGLPEMFEGQPVYTMKLDNPVSQMISSLYNEGLTRADLTESARLKRDFITNNPSIAEALKFKAEMGINRTRVKREGISLADLKSETKK